MYLFHFSVIFLISAMVLHKMCELLTGVYLSSVFQNYESLLILIGFGAVIATIFVCTKYIVKNLKK